MNKITGWLVFWAATTLNKFKLDKAGRTPFQRVTNVHQRRPFATFGENIWYMKMAREIRA